MTEREVNRSDLDGARQELEAAESGDDAERLELLERLHERLETELDTDVEQESPPGR